MGFCVASTWKGRGRSWLSPATVTWYSCMACSSADWVRGLARLISSAISSWAKIGPLMKRKAPAARRRLLQHLGAEDVGGHQVRRELDAADFEAQHRAQRVDELRLGEAGHADHEAVAAGQDGDQRVLDDLGLAEHDLADRLARLGDLLDGGFGGAHDHRVEAGGVRVSALIE